MHVVESSKRVVRFLNEVRRTPSPRLAYICGWLGNDNLGDEALFEAQAELFRPFSLINFQAERSVAYLNKWTHTFVGGVLAGGTIINQDRLFLLGFERAVTHMEEVIVFGSGVRDPRFWQSKKDWVDNRQRWRDSLRDCAFVGVRGPISASLLEEVGVSAEVVGDPALVFFNESRVLEKRGSELRLGLNIGQSHGNVWGSEEDIAAQYVILARRARRQGWTVTWFVVWPEDLDVTLRVAAESGTAQDIFIEYRSAERYMVKAREMTVFVGMKLHATILAICAGVPALMIEYRPKCRDFMMSINQDDANIRADEFCGEEAFVILQSWSDEIDARRALLFEDVSALATKQRQRARDIAERISTKKK